MIPNRYKQKFSFEERKKESNRVKSKFYDHVPVIVQKYNNDDIEISKSKFLVQKYNTMSEFIIAIRRFMNLSPDRCVYILLENNLMLPSISDNVSKIYDTNKDEDGFLYLRYSNEACFG